MSLARKVGLWGRRNPKYYYVMPPSVWGVMIYVTGLMPVEPDGPLEPLVAFPGADKVAHVALYAVFSALILRGWQRDKIPPLDLHVLVLGLCLVFGAMIEVHQGLVGYRSFDMYDILADAAGAITGQAIWHLAVAQWGRRTRLYPGLLRPDFKDHPSNRPRKTRDP